MHVILDLCVVPMGVGVSVSRYIAACQPMSSVVKPTTSPSGSERCEPGSASGSGSGWPRPHAIAPVSIRAARARDGIGERSRGCMVSGCTAARRCARKPGPPMLYAVSRHDRRGAS